MPLAPAGAVQVSILLNHFAAGCLLATPSANTSTCSSFTVGPVFSEIGVPLAPAVAV